MTPRRLLSSLVLTFLVAAILIPAVVAPARADYRVDCNPDGDSRLVVLLVHGFNSGPDTWGGAAVDTLTAGGLDACVVRFDYSEASTRWVTDPAIGPELAASIDSWSTTSRRAGGPGPVVIVAHSMGGLAARCALNTACAGRDVADDVATVVTMGTPYLGSGLRGTALTPAFNLLAAVAAADCRLRRWTDPTVAVTAALGLCRQIEALGTSEASLAFTPGSDQLESLHALPSHAATYATAGRAALVTSFFGRMRVELGSVGDLVVGVESALDGARTSQGRGGTETVDCGTVNLATTPGVGVGVVPWPDLSCTHVTETSDSRFLAAARRQIAASVTTAVDPVQFVSSFPDGREYGIDFDSPSRNIHCTIMNGSVITWLDTWRFGCSIAQYEFADPPDLGSCDVAYGGGFVVTSGNAVVPLCRGGAEFGGEWKEVSTLPYGSAVTYEGVTCRSDESGITCLDATGIGFSLSRSNYTLFE